MCSHVQADVASAARVNFATLSAVPSSQTRRSPEGSSKPVVPVGWKMITSKSTGKVYWYHKQTGKSTWDPPPGSIYATNGGSEEDGDGLPARSSVVDPVCDSEGNVVPYAFTKPAPGGNWMSLRAKEQEVAAQGKAAQRILVCGFDVDALGMVLVPMGMNPASVQPCFKVDGGYGGAAEQFIGEIISLPELANLLGPVIYFWTLKLAVEHVKREWTVGTVGTVGTAAVNGAGSKRKMEDSEDVGGRDKKRKGSEREDLPAKKRHIIVSDNSDDECLNRTAEKVGNKPEPVDVSTRTKEGPPLAIPRKSDVLRVPRKGELPRIPKKGDVIASSPRFGVGPGVVGGGGRTIVSSPRSAAAGPRSPASARSPAAPFCMHGPASATKAPAASDVERGDAVRQKQLEMNGNVKAEAGGSKEKGADIKGGEGKERAQVSEVREGVKVPEAVTRPAPGREAEANKGKDEVGIRLKDSEKGGDKEVVLEGEAGGKEAAGGKEKGKDAREKTKEGRDRDEVKEVAPGVCEKGTAHSAQSVCFEEASEREWQRERQMGKREQEARDGKASSSSNHTSSAVASTSSALSSIPTDSPRPDTAEPPRKKKTGVKPGKEVAKDLGREGKDLKESKDLLKQTDHPKAASAVSVSALPPSAVSVRALPPHPSATPITPLCYTLHIPPPTLPNPPQPSAALLTAPACSPPATFLQPSSPPTPLPQRCLPPLPAVTNARMPPPPATPSTYPPVFPGALARAYAAHAWVQQGAHARADQGNAFPCYLCLELRR
jgi:hypothetical protein